MEAHTFNPVQFSHILAYTSEVRGSEQTGGGKATVAVLIKSVLIREKGDLTT